MNTPRQISYLAIVVGILLLIYSLIELVRPPSVRSGGPGLGDSGAPAPAQVVTNSSQPRSNASTKVPMGNPGTPIPIADRSPEEQRFLQPGCTVYKIEGNRLLTGIITAEGGFVVDPLKQPIDITNGMPISLHYPIINEPPPSKTPREFEKIAP